MADPTQNPVTAGDEAHERDLNRHRGEEQRSARAEAEARLRDRGIVVRDSDSLEMVVQTLDAVEAFEQAVQRRGGDLMIDTSPARQPDDARFVIPMRGDGEAAEAFVSRLQFAAGKLLRAD